MCSRVPCFVCWFGCLFVCLLFGVVVWVNFLVRGGVGTRRVRVMRPTPTHQAEMNSLCRFVSQNKLHARDNYRSMRSLMFRDRAACPDVSSALVAAFRTAVGCARSLCIPFADALAGHRRAAPVAAIMKRCTEPRIFVVVVVVAVISTM